MIEIDSALYRMKAYSSLLMESVEHQQKDVGQDIRTLIRWIDHARPLLGAVTPEAQGVNPFARHGLGSLEQQQGMQQQGFNTATEPKPVNPPEPTPDDTVVEKPVPPLAPPAEPPTEEKPPA